MRERPAFIDFDDQLKELIEKAEKATNDNFSKIKAMIGSSGGVYTAKQLLAQRERFSYRFKKLRDADLLDLSVESLVIKFADTNLFEPSDIETARWRLANARQAKDD